MKLSLSVNDLRAEEMRLKAQLLQLKARGMKEGPAKELLFARASLAFLDAASIDLAACLPHETTPVLGHSEKVLSPRAIEGLRPQSSEGETSGLYLMKDDEDQYFLARPKSKMLWWEKIARSDLLDLGVQCDDVEKIIPYFVYRLPLVGIAVHTGDSFA